MRFGVVVCTQCRRARGVDLSSSSTACPRCGKRAQVSGLRVFFRAEDAETLALAVGAVQARILSGDLGLVADAARLQADVAAEIAEKRRAQAAVDAPPTGLDAAAAAQWAASRAVGAQGDQARADRILEALDQALSDGWGEADLEAAFAAAGLPQDRAEKEIRRALARDELFEPRPGVWKRLV